MPYIESAIKWVRVRHVFVWIPQFNGGVQITNSMFVTPVENGGCINVPCKVKEQITFGDPRRQELVQVLWRDATNFVCDAQCDEICNAITIVKKVNDRDGVGSNLHVANEKWKSALCNTAATKNEDAAGDKRL